MHPRGFQQLLSYRKDGANCFTVPINFNMDVVFVPKCGPFEEHYHKYTGWFRPAKESHSAVLGIMIPRAYSIGTGTRWKSI
jgi:hypothetical protein